jgi:glycosyltransferase involved in cell wall biosynthesis
MKITVITARFTLSGVPLAQIRFARALARRGHDVKMIFCDIDSTCSLPDLHDLLVDVWNFPRVRNAFWPMVREFRVEKPDVVFSAEDHLTAIVLASALFSLSTARISGSSRILPNDRFAYSNRMFSKGWFFKYAMRLAMGRASALTCVSEDMVDRYKQIFPNGPHTCVYNIIKDSSSLQRSQETLNHPWFQNKSFPIIIAAGTFTIRKGFFDLLEAFSTVHRKRKARLILLGDGYLRGDLQSFIRNHCIDDVVDMPGIVSNPLAFFARSDVFVLSSYAEGLPNVLVEAMMCGCTPVATDCPTGPRELLQGGRLGYLVPMHDPKAMAAAIECALDCPTPKNLLDEAVAPFEETRVIDRHFEMLGLCNPSSI